MGSWDYTSYVRTSDVPRIVRVLEFLFQQEGYAPVETDGAAWPESCKEAIQYDMPERKQLAFAVLPGLKDWSIIKTAPFDILARPVPHHHSPRLSIVAGWLCCEAIYAQIEDSSYFSLIEVNARGRVAMKGGTMYEMEYEN